MKQASRIWDDRHRDIAWSVLSFSRRDLGLNVSPTISGAFALLHHYFSVNNETPYDLNILLTSSLMLSCKIFDEFRSFNRIFKAFCQACCKITSLIPDKIIRCALGNRDYSILEPTPEEVNALAHIEVAILNSIRWNMQLITPFTYLNNLKVLHQINISEKEIDMLSGKILQNMCLIMKSSEYLTLDMECSAAAAIEYAFGSIPMNEGTQQWVESIKETRPDEYEKSMNIVIQKSKTCVQVK